MEKKNLQEQFVPYDIALLIKSAGFDEPCIAGYGINRGDGEWDERSFSFNSVVGSMIRWNGIKNSSRISAPLWWQATDWLKKLKPRNEKLEKLIYWAQKT